MSGRAWRFVWGWYVKQLNTRPLLTQASTTGIICGVGDVIAQQAVERRGLRRQEWSRSAKMSLIGFTFTGPVLRGWFALLDRTFGPSMTASVVVKKLLMDQCIFAPLLFLCLLPLFSYSQGLRGHQIKDKVKKEYFNMYTSSLKFWPFVQTFNFYFIPLKFRVSFVNIAAVAWNSYVAWLAHR